MTLPSFSKLPFFEPKHSLVRDKVRDWLEKEPNIDFHDEADANAISKKFVISQGKAGLLEYLVADPDLPDISELDVRSICILREEIAYRSALADSALVVQGIATAGIARFGSKKLQEIYLGGTRRGELIPAFALSEPGGGSDVSATKTKAIKDGDDYILSGTKMWTSNAGVADFYVVVARTGTEKEGAKGLSAFVIDADMKGFRVGDPIITSAPHPMAFTHYENVRVPKWRMVGRPGDGFPIAMSTLDIFRPTVGAACLGIARRALDETLAWISERELYGRRMADIETVQFKIADMMVNLELAALATYRAAWTRDHADGQRTTLEASMAKLVGSEAAFKVVDEAVQLFGGMGVTRGSVVEHLYRDIRAMRVYEGASEVHRSILGRAVAKSAKRASS
ncbi:MAG: acyl-CoA dehydrogenase family protein [Henriciella sp.]|uniref:acyl-CoA dehydrogenase family protein n=1 Tax=Henriciella sp. TaxID=1968823 RepID=UPI0032F01F69